MTGTALSRKAGLASGLAMVVSVDVTTFSTASAMVLMCNWMAETESSPRILATRDCME